MDIDEILNGQAPEETPVADEPATPETPEPAPEVADPSQPRDEHGRFAPKGETQPTEAEAAPPAAKNEPPPGLLEERRKRQDAEAELNALRQQLQQQQPQPAQQPYIPSIYEDENGFATGLTQLAVQQAQQALMPHFQERMTQMTWDMQERIARLQHPDWEEKANVFIEKARENPMLFEEMRRAPDAAEFAYKWGRNAMEVQQIGSLDIEAIKQAAVQEYLAKQPAAAPSPPIPTSLADAPSARAQALPVGPPSLNDILARK